MLKGGGVGTRGDATAILRRLNDGDATAAAELLPLVYQELRGLAGHYMKGERSGHTLQPTALVHEAYLRLVGSAQPEYNDRRHFLAIAARAMRQVLIQHARHRRRAKRGGEWQQVSLSIADAEAAGDPGHDVDILCLHDALERLEELSERQAFIVELRYFAGMTVREVAETLGVGLTTVQDDWAFARAWLLTELSARSS